MQQGSRSGLTRDEMSAPQTWVDNHVYMSCTYIVLILTHVCSVHLRIGSVLKSGTGGGGGGHPLGAVGMVATQLKQA